MIKSDGSITPYLARNGGGYTLEAELGILPNSYSEPDLLGWERGGEAGGEVGGGGQGGGGGRGGGGGIGGGWGGGGGGGRG